VGKEAGAIEGRWNSKGPGLQMRRDGAVSTRDNTWKMAKPTSEICRHLFKSKGALLRRAGDEMR
jgi:hypothetical protein